MDTYNLFNVNLSWTFKISNEFQDNRRVYYVQYKQLLSRWLLGELACNYLQIFAYLYKSDSIES